MAIEDVITKPVQEPAEPAVVETPTIEGEGEHEGTPPVLETEEESQKVEKNKRQNRLDRRFKELTSKINTLSSDAFSLRETLTALTGEAPPVRTEYNTVEEYTDAIEDYRDKLRGPKALLDAVEQQQDKTSVELRETLMEDWGDKVAEIRKTIPKFSEVVKAANIPLHPVLETALLKHKAGPAIVYFLATHQETARELTSLPIDEQLLELSKIASKVQAGRKVVPVATETEDQPIPPPPTAEKVIGGAIPRKKAPGEMSLTEYAAWRKAGGGN